jgi:AcrR family transcriptional regulator
MSGRDRNAEREPGIELDFTGAKILDAALQVLIDFGFKRATVELVAKVAGVAHTTVYRRWPTKNALLRTAAIREVQVVFNAALSTVDEGASFEEQVLSVFTDVVWSVHTHPLTARELKTEPEAVLPLLTTGSSAVLSASLDYVAQRLLEIAGASGVTLDDPESLADILIRLAHSLVLVPNPGRPLRKKADVSNYARRYLGPLTRSAVDTGVRS